MDMCTWMVTAFYFPLLFSVSIESPAEAAGIQANKTETDRLALLAFKGKIIIDPFQVLSSWNDSLGICKWQGVTCSPQHLRVAELALFLQGLVGSLSPHIGNLTFLRKLRLQNNSFHGEIPPEIGRLHRLQSLALHNNSFVGKIPVNISGCGNLQRLYLSSNMIQGKIPTELGSLSNLRKMHFYRNDLTGGIPSFIGNMSSLQIIDLSDNILRGSIPNSFSQLESLTSIGLGINMLSGIVPPLLYNISSLETVVLTQNQLIGRLPSKSELPNLKRFMIAHNQFSGTIPVSLFNASKLQLLDLTRNNFFGKVPVKEGNLKELRLFHLTANSLGSGKTDDLDFLATLTNCTSLERLNIAGNHFGGVLPDSISNLSNHLSILYMGGNQIHGTIPSGIQNCINLIALGMQNNFLDGSIPFSIGMLQNLQVLRLHGNRLSGPLPSSLGNMSHLYQLNLSNNILEGNIISDITKCQFLQIIDLSNNNLNGTIPEEVTDLSSKLLSLGLDRNSLTGSLPVHLGKFQNLQLLDISENKMSGEIPSSIGECWSLQNLYLKDNFFHGPIPSSFKSLKDIRILDLSMNNFSGKIPNELGYLPSLQALDLSSNNLEGGVPTEGVFRNISAFAVLGNPKLCGGIPELQLPACQVHRSKKRSLSLTLKVTLGAVLSSVGVTFFVVTLYWRRRPEVKRSSKSIPRSHFGRVSYQELHHATNGFSSANLIGVGSFGSVYKGLRHEDKAPVAVKVFNLTEREASKSFTTECDAFRKIRHRNLIKVLTVCSSVDSKGNDFKALVLTFMPNGSLEKCLHPSSDGRHPTTHLNLSKRLNISIDIASALDYLHNHCETPIVHCDLKPSNILLDEDMTAHVGDFGLTKILPQSSNSFNISESSSISPKGTVGYIPPEYGTGAQVSTQGDVYSFGILLLEMFTGKKPTDEMFKDGLTLHHFSSMACPSQVMDIVDPRMLLQEDHDEAIINSAHHTNMNDEVLECIISIFTVGVACSAESQSERIGINDALTKLHAIKEAFHGARTTRDTQAPLSDSYLG